MIVTKIDFDEWGNLYHTHYNSGAIDEWTWDPATGGTRLSIWTVGTNGAVPQVRNYTYDDADRFSQAGDWSSIQYDPNSRLKAATGLGLVNALNFDPFGNNIYSSP